MTETVIRCNEDWVAACRARKDVIGLSNAQIDAKLFSDGQCDKYLGLMPVKNMSVRLMFEVVEYFGWELVVRPCPANEARWRPTWQGRESRNVRVPKRRVSKAIMERAKPLFHKVLAKTANTARNRLLSGEHRSRIARNAALIRWRKRKKRREHNA